MKLENEFTVAAPVERVWGALLDLEGVASCLPGAKIEPDTGDGLFRGAMKVKLGPMIVNYSGTAQLAEVDEDTHTASIAVQAREAKGHGTAAATIRNRVEGVADGTRVVAETDLQITGRQAQFGRGIMQDVAETMLGEFADQLEQKLSAPPEAAPSPSQERRTVAAADDEVLDLGSVMARTPVIRYAAVGAVALAIAALFALLARRSKPQP
jgi:carbon monoxide dehydrogenase subunit G